MSEQGSFSWGEPPRRVSRARQIGLEAEEACKRKAERTTDFDSEAAQEAALEYLAIHGPTRGEVIVNALKRQGHSGHDDRCFGSVFSALSKRELIRCVGYAEREKGHGTSGGRIWKLRDRG